MIADTEKGIMDEDKMKVSQRLLAALEEGEQSARTNRWLSADEVEAVLGHD